jgi:hypothetical protein
MFLLNGILDYFRDDPSTIDYWLMVFNLSFGTYALIYGLFVSFDIMGVAPKVVVSSEGLFLKSKAAKSGKHLDWENIQSITFHSFQLDFKLDTEPVFFHYNCSAETSKKIKDAIRDMADLKNIEVLGG